MYKRHREDTAGAIDYEVAISGTILLLSAHTQQFATCKLRYECYRTQHCRQFAGSILTFTSTFRDLLLLEQETNILLFLFLEAHLQVEEISCWPARTFSMLVAT